MKTLEITWFCPVALKMAASFLPSLTLCSVVLGFFPSLASADSSNNCSHLSHQTEGPFWVEEHINSSNVRHNLTFGVPLNLTLKVADGILSSLYNRCVPIEGAKVDLWQARYDGMYSDAEFLHSKGQKWLRGYQLTDGSGYATFNTIYPGWYHGRTVHIHLRVRLYNHNGSTSYDDTTQLYFDDEISDLIFENVYPYNNRSAVRDTYNNDDRIFAGNNVINLTGSYMDKRGYSSTVELSVPFTDSHRERSNGSRSDGQLAEVAHAHGLADAM